MQQRFDPAVAHVSQAGYVPHPWNATTLPTKDFVISRRPDGNPLSFYGDDVWDFTPYEKHQRNKTMTFFPGGRVPSSSAVAELKEESKRLLFLVINKPKGRILAVSTILNYSSAVKILAKHCHRTSISLFEFLSSYTQLTMYAESRPTGTVLKFLSSIIGILRSYGSNVLGYPVFGQSIQRTIRTFFKENSDSNQHPPIPTGILSELIINLSNEIEDYLAVEAQFEDLVRACTATPLSGRKTTSQVAIRKRHADLEELEGAEFRALIEKFRLVDYFSKKSLSDNVSQIPKHLLEIQLAAKSLIHAFSGMRDDEGTTLPYQCAETSDSSGMTHCLIKGETTKLSGGRIKVTRWVTSPEGHWAISCARSIAKLIYECEFGKDFEAHLDVIGDFLFVSPGRLLRKEIKKNSLSKQFSPSSLDMTRYPALRSRILPIISGSDIAELESIDPNREWCEEAKFAIGELWPLTSHQFRRSLALYARRSGLVSLPTLRRQLKHIRNAMATYYAEGSSFADNFIGEDMEHFGKEWRSARHLSEGLSFWLNVIKTEDELFGGHSKWLKNRFMGAEGIFLTDRTTTLKQFKRGELTYKETFLGGCTSVEPCKKVGINVMNLECLAGSENLVGNKTKLTRVMKAQRALVEGMQPESVEFRTERRALDLLERAFSKTNQPDF